MNSGPVINLHIYLSDITHQSRIAKETTSIAKLGLADEIIIVSRWKEGALFTEQLDEARKVVRIPLRTTIFPNKSLFNFLKYLEFACRVIWKFRSTKVRYIQCHQVFLLPIALYFKYVHKSILIYDAHELETEWMGFGKWTQKVAKWIERRAMKDVDELIVVSDSIGQWYRKEYAFSRVHVIRNIPSVPDGFPEPSDYFRKKFNLHPDTMIFIYHGLISDARGLEVMLEVFSKIDHQKCFVVMGYGPKVPLIKEYQEQHTNIFYHEAVMPADLLRYSSGADVGISLPGNCCLSYYYSLPNKVFEYLSSGIPIIVSDFPEMSYLVDTYDCGWKIEPDEEALYSLVNAITPEMIRQKREKVLQCREFFKWENEEKKLSDIYRAKPVA